MKIENTKLAIPALVYSLFSFFSKITGYLRDLFLALFLGTSVIADIFFIAFRLPNSFRRALSEETFNSAYIPIYGKLSETKKQNLKHEFTAKLFTFFTMLTLIIILLAEIFMPQILSIFSYGYVGQNQQEMLITASRIIFPFLMAITLSALLLANLNANNKFAFSGVISSILNLVIVLAIYCFDFFVIEKIFFLAYAVIFGGIVQIIFLFYFVDRAFWPILFRINKNEIKLNNFFELYWPTFLSSSFFQVNLIIGIVICSFQAGAVSYIYYSERLFYFPLTLIGIAIGIVLVPNLSNLLRNHNKPFAVKYMHMAMKYGVVTTLPLTAFLFISSPEVVSFIFERGEFGSESSKYTSTAFRAFLLGLPAATFIRILTTYFFAIERPKIPLIASVKSNVINLVLMLLLFYFLGFLGIPLALSIATWVLFFLLLIEHRCYDFFVIDAQLKYEILIYSLFSIFIFLSGYLLKQISFFLSLEPLNKIIIMSSLSFLFYVIFVILFDKPFLKQLKTAVNNLKLVNN